MLIYKINMAFNTKQLTHNPKLCYLCSVFNFGKNAKPLYLNNSDD
jgi:hypothetical protein